MGATVRVNERTVVHKTSEGVSFAFPDICMVPDVGPLPFLNLAMSTDADDDTSTSVFADGHSVMLKDSSFSRSYGDELGTDGGVISGCWNGKASFANYSYDVMVEGRNVARLTDPMLHNHGSPPNAFNPAEHQPNAAGQLNMMAIMCFVFCACYFAGLKTDCCRRALADEKWRYDWPIARRYWDPKIPGVYVEVPFEMPKDGRPPQPMMDKDRWGQPDQRSENPAFRDPSSPEQGMPLPGGDIPWVPGSRRPDAVTAKDPTKPLDDPGPDGKGNIGDIYEFKFPPDEWRNGQREAYEKIAPGHVHEISPETCECEKHFPKPMPAPDPQGMKDAIKKAKGPMVVLAYLLFAWYVYEYLKRQHPPEPWPVPEPAPAP